MRRGRSRRAIRPLSSSSSLLPSHSPGSCRAQAAHCHSSNCCSALLHAFPRRPTSPSPSNSRLDPPALARPRLRPRPTQRARSAMHHRDDDDDLRRGKRTPRTPRHFSLKVRPSSSSSSFLHAQPRADSCFPTHAPSSSSSLSVPTVFDGSRLRETGARGEPVRFARPLTVLLLAGAALTRRARAVRSPYRVQALVVFSARRHTRRRRHRRFDRSLDVAWSGSPVLLVAAARLDLALRHLDEPRPRLANLKRRRSSAKSARSSRSPSPSARGQIGPARPCSSPCGRPHTRRPSSYKGISAAGCRSAVQDEAASRSRCVRSLQASSSPLSRTDSDASALARSCSRRLRPLVCTSTRPRQR